MVFGNFSFHLDSLKNRNRIYVKLFMFLFILFNLIVEEFKSVFDSFINLSYCGVPIQEDMLSFQPTFMSECGRGGGGGGA
jgi:hypothetical protein